MGVHFGFGFGGGEGVNVVRSGEVVGRLELEFARKVALTLFVESSLMLILETLFDRLGYIV